MFRELRATAPQTYYTFRTSNGTADVLYVLLELLTALGLQALFFRRAKMWAYYLTWCALRAWYMDEKEEAIFFSLKPPQTYDNSRWDQGFRRRRATKKKMDFSRWIFMNKKKVKIILVLLMFLSFWENQVFWTFPSRTLFGAKVICSCIIYIKY